MNRKTQRSHCVPLLKKNMDSCKTKTEELQGNLIKITIKQVDALTVYHDNRLII